MLKALVMVGALCSAMPAWADAKLTVLMDVLEIDDVVDILRSEGLAYGASLDQQMLQGAGGPFFTEQVRRLYDPQVMERGIRDAFAEEMSAEDIEATIAFYATETGARIVQSENRTRRALSDPALLDAAEEMVAAVRADSPEVFAQIESYIETNDLVGNNVSGALNQNYYFLKGLSDGSYAQRPDDVLLDEVWRDRDAITSDTKGWLMAFLTVAYAAMPLEDLNALVSFSDTEAGRALNRALFAGFGDIYRDISYGLGRAVALNAMTDEI